MNWKLVLGLGLLISGFIFYRSYSLFADISNLNKDINMLESKKKSLNIQVVKLGRFKETKKINLNATEVAIKTIRAVEPLNCKLKVDFKEYEDGKLKYHKGKLNCKIIGIEQIKQIEDVLFKLPIVITEYSISKTRFDAILKIYGGKND